MLAPEAEFVMSTEQECLTAPAANSHTVDRVASRLFQALRGLAPTLSATTGIQNGYGRIYIDNGAGPHLELAACECDSPYLLASIVERQHRLVSRAVAELAEQGVKVVLVNNNHSGLLRDNCATWGAHENYMTDRHPAEFGELLLPFLITRIYAGAGGILFPSGSYLAGVRPMQMKQDTGGDTTACRAIHSTAREEHHMGPAANRYRYHGILGDGHRSQFNLALQFGATALAIKAACHDKQLPDELTKLDAYSAKTSYVGLIRRLNVLASPGKSLSIDPLIKDTQRLYWQAAQRFAETLDRPPAWIGQILREWDDTLSALENENWARLATRLDAFAKYEFFSAFLQEEGISWSELAGRPQLFATLTLLDQSYHEFCNPESLFRQLERAGALCHEVTGVHEPGSESEPFVPETTTRAATRARFIRDHNGDERYLVDWSMVFDLPGERQAELFNPFGQQFGEWRPATARRRGRDLPPRRTLSVDRVDAMRDAYERGAFQEVLDIAQRVDHESCHATIRYTAWARARCGHLDAADYLARLHRGAMTLNVITDYACAYRFRGLAPANEITDYIELGREYLDDNEDASGASAALREHIAAYLLACTSDADRALRLLGPFLSAMSPLYCESRIQARILCSAAECFRRRGSYRKADRLLRRGEAIFAEIGNEGELAEFALNGRAKLAGRGRRAFTYLEKARLIEEGLGHKMALVRTLLIEARFTNDSARTNEILNRVKTIREELSALTSCRLLSRILDNWDEWSHGDRSSHSDYVDNHFWGL